MASNPDASLDELLELVKEVCTKDQIQRLLRAAKKTEGDGSEVRITGSAKAVVFQHLRDAIQTGKVSREAVYALIGESEESGKQHIFYFKPKDERVIDACNDAERIASRLFGPDWKNERSFPRYHFRASEFQWTDFRIMPTEVPGQAGWVAKAYAGIMRVKHVDTRREAPNRIVKVFEEALSREIYLVRWRASGLLELRVPLEKKHKMLLGSVHALWTAIASAVSSNDFEPFDLMMACRRIIDSYAENAEDYRLGDAHLLDSGGGTARLSPGSGEEHLMHVEARRRAIELFVQCRLLVVVWLLNDDSHDTDLELRTVVGKSRPNEVAMVSRTTAKAVDHVTRRLLQFAR